MGIQGNLDLGMLCFGHLLGGDCVGRRLQHYIRLRREDGLRAGFCRADHGLQGRLWTAGWTVDCRDNCGGEARRMRGRGGEEDEERRRGTRNILQ